MVKPLIFCPFLGGIGAGELDMDEIDAKGY
jgi:hypothetical protein